MSSDTEDVIEEGIDISFRDITNQEKLLLSNKQDIEVTCQGSNTHVWKLENELPIYCSIFTNLEVILVALGGEHIVALTADKRIFAEGCNEYGQLGLGDTKPRNGLCPITQLQECNIKRISCGARHSVAISNAGELFSWGDSREGQCGLGAKGVFTKPTKVNFAPLKKSNETLPILRTTSVKEASCAELFTACIDARGAVWSWGKGIGLGHGKDVDQCLIPTLVKGLRRKKAVKIACGSFHCVAVTQDDFEGSQLQLLSPDYRTASVSSSYFTELQVRKDIISSRVPFLQTSFFSSDSDKDDSPTTLRRVHSDTEITKHASDQPHGEDSVSISETDLRNLTVSTKGIKPDDHEKSSSSNAPSVASSEYSSVVDLRMSLETDRLSRQSETNLNDYKHNDDSISIISNSSAVSGQNTENSADASATVVQNNGKEDISPGGTNLFDGKKSLFDNSKKDRLQTLQSFSIIETDDESLQPTVSSCLTTESDSNYGSLETVLSTEVWSWGRNVYGQLGHGDVIEKYVPTMITKLCRKHVIHVTAGSYHTLVVTIDGQVFSWGDNAFGQIAHDTAFVSIPKKIEVLDGTRIWDATAGRNFSLFLGDIERNKSDVYFSGEYRRQKIGRSISNPIVELTAADRKKVESRWKLSRRVKRNSEGFGSPHFVDIQIRKLLHFEQNEAVKYLTAYGYSFSCVTEKIGDGSMVEAIYKFTRSERLFHQQLSLIRKSIIGSLVTTESWLNVTKLAGGESLISLVDSFMDLLHGITTELTHLTDIVRYNLPTKELFSYLFSDSFRAVYDRYSQCYCDALAVGIISACNKPASGIISKLKDVMKNLERNLSLTQITFESLLKAPLMRSHVYCDIAKRISAHCESKFESDHLKEVISRWLSFSDTNSKRLILAGTTKNFWNDCHTKIAEALKDPQRRVLKSSKVDPLTLSRASRLSSHSYILCNDVFVHVQYNRNFQVFPLVTLWADSVDDGDYAQNAIRIATPEEWFVLSAGTPLGKIAWLTELNQAIASCLSACSTFSLDLPVNSLSGLLKAAVAREASYTYANHSVYRTASYKGMWMSGLPHGRGKMIWEDGSVYEGEFVEGQFHGHGHMFWPKTTSSDEKKYDGEWFEGQMCGHGTMRYGTFEEYVGYFKDGMRDGHGTFKTSRHKTSLDTIYIGDWVNDVKSGYGVLDYVIRGEKYMGMWLNDQRQGYGVVVTVDGVYYEGKFFQNRLAGQGILLNEDDTCYEGEFTADMLLSGKGVLTLPNGDAIDGTFYGNWGDSIKVNGVFSKFSNPLIHNTSEKSQGNRLGTTDFTIDANAKWSSLFEQCLSELGWKKAEDTEPDIIWKHVTDVVLRAAGSITGVSRRTSTKLDLDFIRNRDYKDLMDLAKNLKGLQEYLSQVFDTIGHPLNTLVEGLVEVYRATYVGVGAHRRLLPHAVAEAKSYVTRLFNVLRILFPDLHDEEFVLLSNDTADGVLETPVNSMSLLHPLLLPRLYPPLFTLYALQTEKADAVYTEKLYYLNKRGDIALLSFLGVRQTFWLMPSDIDSASSEQLHGEQKRSYVSAIDMLENISTTYSPMGKIEIIRKTFASIHEEINNYYKGIRKVLAMDDLFPLFQYIVIRARVPHLRSEIQFIEDLVDESILTGEAGHMVTTLCACYFQIQNERDRD